MKLTVFAVVIEKDGNSLYRTHLDCPHEWTRVENFQNIKFHTKYSNAIAVRDFLNFAKPFGAEVVTFYLEVD